MDFFKDTKLPTPTNIFWFIVAVSIFMVAFSYSLSILLRGHNYGSSHVEKEVPQVFKNADESELTGEDIIVRHISFMTRRLFNCDIVPHVEVKKDGCTNISEKVVEQPH